MSTLATNAITDASGGNTASINGYTPTMSNMAGRNRIINGDMRIDQRNAGASGTAANYTVDRFNYVANQASKGTWQQNAGSVTPPTGFSNYLGFTSSSAYSVLTGDYFAFTQKIEGYNFSDLGWGTANAKTVTLSFWVRSSLTGTFGGALYNGTPRSYPFSYTISSADTWTQISITIVGDTSGTYSSTNSTAVQVLFGLGVGSTYSGTAGLWSDSIYFSATGATSVVGTNGATFYITGVQLEAGSVATPFEHRQYGQELALCQRYYQLVEGFAAGSYSSTNLLGSLSFPVVMRASPTVSATAAIAITYPGVADYTQSSAYATIVAGRVTSRGIQVELGNFSGMTSGRVHYQNVGINNAALAVSSEL